MAAWVADGLTAFRLVLTPYLVWIGFVLRNEPAAALTAICHALLLGWTADILDGWFARKALTPTRLGHLDFALDMLMVLGSVVGLTAAGLLSVKGTIVYLAVATTLIWWFPTKGMTMAVACPAVFAPFCLAAFWAPDAFYLALLWVSLVLIFDWRRFEGVVLEFIDTFPSRSLKHLGSWWRQRRGLVGNNSHPNAPGSL